MYLQAKSVGIQAVCIPPYILLRGVRLAPLGLFVSIETLGLRPDATTTVNNRENVAVTRSFRNVETNRATHRDPP